MSIHHNDLRWARWWARRYAWAAETRGDIDGENLSQAAMLGILRAREGFREGCGSWAQYSSYFIRQEVRRLIGIRQARLPPVAQSLDAAADEDGPALLELLPDEEAPGPEELAELHELQAGVRRAVERLPDARQRQVIRLHRLEGWSEARTAVALGMSAQDVRRLDRAARRGPLAQDEQLRALADLTPYFRHVSVTAFNTTWTSATEAAALWRIEHEQQHQTASGGPGGR